LGDVDYFKCLYNRYENGFLIYIRRISLVSAQEAEDILQDSFVKIWRSLHGFDTNLKLSSWMYRIIHNETISYWRKSQSFGKDKLFDVDDSIFELKEQDGEGLDMENQSVDLHISLKNIKVKYREILILKYFEGFSYQEISDILKIPEGTVATRLNRAKLALLTYYNKIHTI